MVEEFICLFNWQKEKYASFSAGAFWSLLCKTEREVDKPEAQVGFCQTGCEGTEVVTSWSFLSGRALRYTVRIKICQNLTIQSSSQLWLWVFGRERKVKNFSTKFYLTSGLNLSLFHNLKKKKSHFPSRCGVGFPH